MLGCIADDFTGAGDAASFMAKSGLRVLLCCGVPDWMPMGMDAVVIALKTRTMPTDEAVAQSRRALECLKRAGADRFYVKYCSTFDSTPTGNIGPVCDMALEMTGADYTLLCPSLPVNGRTVKDGRLFVNGVPLEESTMKDHPLTPMWDSRLSELMRRQSRYPVFSVGDLKEVRALKERGSTPFYAIPDYETDEQGKAIAEEFQDLPLLTGGSGLLEAMGGLMGGGREPIAFEGVPTPALVLAGSCSVATRNQSACWRKSGRAYVHLDVSALVKNETAERNRLFAFLEEHAREDVLIDSSEEADRVRLHRQETEDVSGRIERAMTALALRGRELGYRRLIVAGGETSGAITSALGYSMYEIGVSIAPGVPLMVPLEARDVRLVLKSGNFGQEDFFLRALQKTGGTANDA